MNTDSTAFHRAAVAIVEVTTDVVGMASPEGHTLYLNGAGRALLGIGADQGLDDVPIATFHPAWAWKVLQEEGIPTALEEGSWSGETALLTTGGEEVPVWQLVLAHRDEEGDLHFISTVARDLRFRVETETRLQERIKELRTLYAVTHITAGWDRPLESRLQELVELLPPGWLHPELTEAEIQLGRTHCRTPGFQGHPRILEAPIRNGAEVVGAVRVGLAAEAPRLPGPDASFLPEERELLEAVAGAIGKALERETLQESLIQAQKIQTIGRLAGGTAHDFNNLLTVIKGHAALALDALAPGDPAREDLEHLMAAAERGSNLTGQLLAFSRKQVLQARAVDLREVVGHLDPMLRRLVPSRIELVMESGEDPVPAWVDPGKLEQVILNLVVNAVDAMPGNGTLRLRAGTTRITPEKARILPWEVKPGRWSALLVEDTGEGMSPEVLRRIFEPFFTTKAVGSGTGLGLSMAYGFLKQSGGHILVRSVPGKGSTFELLLPSAPPGLREPFVGRSAGDAVHGDDDVEHGGDDPEHGGEDAGFGGKEAESGKRSDPGATTPEGGDGEGGEVTGETSPWVAAASTLDPRESRLLDGPRAPAGAPPVLVVDDSAEVRAVMLRTLARGGYPVLEAGDGEEALALLQEERDRAPALVVADLVMPRVGGAVLVERIRAEHPDMAILLVSGYPRRDHPPALGSLGLPFLAKPFSGRELLVAVRDALRAGGR